MKPSRIFLGFFWVPWEMQQSCKSNKLIWFLLWRDQSSCVFAEFFCKPSILVLVGEILFEKTKQTLLWFLYWFAENKQIPIRFFFLKIFLFSFRFSKSLCITSFPMIDNKRPCFVLELEKISRSHPKKPAKNTVWNLFKGRSLEDWGWKTNHLVWFEPSQSPPLLLENKSVF